MATVYKRTTLIGGASDALDFISGDVLADGDWAFVMAASTLYVYQLDADSGATESSPSVISPDTNPGTKRWILQRLASDNSVPPGTIVAWIGGYFGNSTNGGFTNVLGNSIAAANAYLNADAWHVCDGENLNDGNSAIYNGASRYLPCLTDDRFLMGSTSAGAGGGYNVMEHTHTTASHTLTASEIPSHAHGIPHTNGGTAPSGAIMLQSENYMLGATMDSGLIGGGGSHNHGATGGTSNNENRPRFLPCFYIQKV